jgi:hypothetical protein
MVVKSNISDIINLRRNEILRVGREPEFLILDRDEYVKLIKYVEDISGETIDKTTGLLRFMGLKICILLGDEKGIFVR